LLAGACLLLTLGIWVNTGTLAPLGATLEKPLVWEPCGYLLNIDHFHYKASFLMLDGAPREQWEFSVALRRILYFVVAYPFMKALGFGAGGLVTNVLISCASLVAFWLALQRRFGGAASPAVLWLLATYPGWFYWAGTPYSYAAIVPASLLAMTLLWRLERVDRWPAALAVGLGLGVLFTAYDLLPLFGVAALGLLLWRRRWAAAAALAVAQLLPPLLVNVILARGFGVPFRNSNTEAYWRILGAWLPPYEGERWAALLAQLPRIAVDSFLFSNFLFLPLLFVVALLVGRGRGRDSEVPLLGLAERWLLLMGALLFLFNNAVPPYPGWQLRGLWIARLYQPVLPALIAAIAAASARAPRLPARGRWVLATAVALTLALDGWVVFAPVLGSPGLTGWVYFHFYRHAKRPVYTENLRRYGVRPVGFCTSAPPSPDSATH
jgi:hypothetical protein